MDYSEHQIRTAVLNACQNSGSTLDEAISTWLEIEGQLVDLKSNEINEGILRRARGDFFTPTKGAYGSPAVVLTPASALNTAAPVSEVPSPPTSQSTQVLLHEGTAPVIVRNPMVVTPEVIVDQTGTSSDPLCTCGHHQSAHNSLGCYGWIPFLWFFSRRCPCHFLQLD